MVLAMFRIFDQYFSVFNYFSTRRWHPGICNVWRVSVFAILIGIASKSNIIKQPQDNVAKVLQQQRRCQYQVGFWSISETRRQRPSGLPGEPRETLGRRFLSHVQWLFDENEKPLKHDKDFHYFCNQTAPDGPWVSLLLLLVLLLFYLSMLLEFKHLPLVGNPKLKKMTCTLLCKLHKRVQV